MNLLMLPITRMTRHLMAGPMPPTATEPMVDTTTTDLVAALTVGVGVARGREDEDIPAEAVLVDVDADATLALPITSRWTTMAGMKAALKTSPAQVPEAQ